MCCKHCANNEKNNTGYIRKGRTTRTVKNHVQHHNINYNQESGKFQQHMRQNGANNMEIKTTFKMLHASEQQGRRDQEKQPETPRKTRTWNSKGKSNKKTETNFKETQIQGPGNISFGRTGSCPWPMTWALLKQSFCSFGCQGTMRSAAGSNMVFTRYYYQISVSCHICYIFGIFG